MSIGRPWLAARSDAEGWLPATGQVNGWYITWPNDQVQRCADPSKCNGVPGNYMGCEQIELISYAPIPEAREIRSAIGTDISRQSSRSPRLTNWWRSMEGI